MENNIQMIPIEKIVENPDNPRRSVGDISELSDSIRQNGVLQNLTVVPDGEYYMIVIGHRRCAAARRAGLSEVPCRVADWEKREQLRVMMMENVQRNDLSNIEQADGFQLMLDMGDTVEDIERGTGFSKSTIRRRLSLLNYKRDLVEQAEQRGATLEDYAKINALPEEHRERALAAVQTAEFNAIIKKSEMDEQSKREKAEVRRLVESFSQKTDAEACGKLRYVSYVYRPQLSFAPEDGVKYYHTEDRSGAFQIYRDYTDEETREQRERRKEMEREQQEKDKARRDIEKDNKMFRQLIDDFVAKQTEDSCKKNFEEIAAMACMNGIEIVDEDEDEVKLQSKISSLPHLYIFRCAVEWALKYNIINSWDGKARSEARAIYEVLQKMGYELCEEERRRMSGAKSVDG